MQLMNTNYIIEEYKDTTRNKYIKLFNEKFKLHPSIPLAQDIKAYQIHNQGFPIKFTFQDIRDAVQYDNFFCVLSTAFRNTNKQPSMTGDGQGRVMIVVGKDFQDETKLALYKLDVPWRLAAAATNFDEKDEVSKFEDQDRILVSPPPSRSRAAKNEMPGRSTGRVNTKRIKGEGRPSLRQLLKGVD